VNGVDRKGLTRYLLRHPSQLAAVAGAGWRLRARRWWRRAPFLPLPDQKYWNFRMVTATGSSNGPMRIEDVIHAAQWSRRQRVGR
jgi:hypothetical protein